MQTHHCSVCCEVDTKGRSQVVLVQRENDDEERIPEQKLTMG